MSEFRGTRSAPVFVETDPTDWARYRGGPDHSTYQWLARMDHVHTNDGRCIKNRWSECLYVPPPVEDREALEDWLDS